MFGSNAIRSRLAATCVVLPTGNGVFVMVGWNGTILASSDVLVWTRQPLASGDAFLDVTFASGCFVAVGYKGTIIWSADGLTWIEVQAPTQRFLSSVTYWKWSICGRWH